MHSIYAVVNGLEAVAARRRGHDDEDEDLMPVSRRYLRRRMRAAFSPI